MKLLIMSIRNIRRLIVCSALLLTGATIARAQSAEIVALRNNLPHAKDSLAYVDILNQLGMYYHLGNIDSCFWFAKQAREIATRLQYRKGEADALKNLGIVYSQKLNLEEAISCEYQALELYRALGDSGNVCHILNNLSIDYESAGNDSLETYYLHRAMDMGARLPNDSMFSLILTTYILEYESDPAKRDSVKWAYDKLRTITKRYPYSREWLYAKMFEAVRLLKQGGGRQGEALINEVALAAQQKGFLHLAIAAYFRIIDDFIPEGYPADSIAYSAKIFELSRKAGYYDLLMFPLGVLYRYYTGRGDAARAAYYGAAVLDLANRQYTVRVSRQEKINYIEYFVKEKEMQSLQLGNRIQQQALEKDSLLRTERHLLTWSLIMLLLLVAAFVIIYYRSYRASRDFERRQQEINADISEKNQLLKQNDDFKNKLISIIANDFKDPLNHIIKVSELLQSRSLSHEQMMETIGQVEISSRKTLVIFDNILRWIKSQLSGFVYAPAPCNIKEMFADALQVMQRNGIQEKRLQVTVDIPEGILVSADREMLQFVHRNLLHSAGALSAPGEQIAVLGRLKDGEVEVRVLSARLAVNAATLSNLFEYRQDRQDSELALLICKDFMDKMGGRIGVVATGEGFSFVYSLPSFS